MSEKDAVRAFTEVALKDAGKAKNAAELTAALEDATILAAMAGDQIGPHGQEILPS